MELKLCISLKQPHEKYSNFVRVNFTEEELIKWAKNYASENYVGEHEVTGVDVESIIT